MELSKKATRKLSEKDVVACWDKNANAWSTQTDQGYNPYRDYFEHPTFFDFMGEIKNKKILDACCGEGVSSRRLAQKGAQVTAIDLSGNMLEQAIKKETQVPLGIAYKQLSCSDLSAFSNDSFDIVTSFVALMDCPDYHAALKEFFRVIRPKGDLFFSVLHPCFVTRGYTRADANTVSENQTLTVKQYFDSNPYMRYITHAEVANPQPVDIFEIPTFPRTISCYMNALVEQGFMFKKMAEPQSPDEATRKFPYMKKWQTLATPYWYVHAIKP